MSAYLINTSGMQVHVRLSDESSTLDGLQIQPNSRVELPRGQYPLQPLPPYVVYLPEPKVTEPAPAPTPTATEEE